MDHTGFATGKLPLPRQCVFPGSTLLRLQGSLQGYCPKWALHFMHIPGLSDSGSWFSSGAQTGLAVHFVPFPGWSISGDLVLGECTVSGGLCILYTSPVPAAWSPRCAMRAQFQVCCVSPLGSWSQAVTLLADVNCSGSQENVISSWEPAHSLVEDGVSGAEIAAAPFLPALAVTHLPLCLWGERALYGSSPLVFT